ncbi:MAG: DEAD/DEAH box helicase [Candidatus Promineifilaceae bacterium]
MEQIEDSKSALNGLEGLEPQEPTEDRLPEITLDQLSDKLQAAVARAGWTGLMPVQAKSIPYVSAERDIMVQSRTGSGKTGAFVLPAIDRIDPTRNTCQILILVPTRELANQVMEAASTLSGGTVNTVAVYGGVSYRPQKLAFERGAHLVVGTPGRVLDHLMSGNFLLDDLQMLIFDEADRMLSVGFYEDMKAVQRYMPKERHVNSCMFSATFPPHVLRLAERFQENSAILSLSSDHVHVTDVEHIVYNTGNSNKDSALVKLLEIENPDSAIIFCNTRHKVNYVSVVLRRYGFNADQLSGDLSQHAREHVLARVRGGNLKLLVATDVAARGIDIPDLSHVFQFEVPEDTEAYIHRAGRTGRAGASGTAIMFVDVLEQIRLTKITKLYDIDMQMPELPSDESADEMVEQRALALLETRVRNLDDASRLHLEQYETMVELLSMDADGIRALAMLIDDSYQTAINTKIEEKASTAHANLPRIDTNTMEAIAQKLLKKMERHDTLRLKHLTRFEPMVEQLVMSGEQFHILTLLLREFHAKMGKKKPKSDKKRSSDKSGRGKSYKKSKRNDRGGRGRKNQNGGRRRDR